MGIAFVPSASWKSVEDKEVKLIPIEGRPSRELVLAWDKNKDMNCNYEQFISLAKNWMSYV